MTKGADDNDKRPKVVVMDPNVDPSYSDPVTDAVKVVLNGGPVTPENDNIERGDIFVTPLGARSEAAGAGLELKSNLDKRLNPENPVYTPDQKNTAGSIRAGFNPDDKLKLGLYKECLGTALGLAAAMQRGESPQDIINLGEDAYSKDRGRVQRPRSYSRDDTGKTAIESRKADLPSRVVPGEADASDLLHNGAKKKKVRGEVLEQLQQRADSAAKFNAALRTTIS